MSNKQTTRRPPTNKLRVLKLISKSQSSQSQRKNRSRLKKNQNRKMSPSEVGKDKPIEVKDLIQNLTLIIITKL